MVERRRGRHQVTKVLGVPWAFHWTLPHVIVSILYFHHLFLPVSLFFSFKMTGMFAWMWNLIVPSFLAFTSRTMGSTRVMPRPAWWVSLPYLTQRGGCLFGWLVWEWLSHLAGRGFNPRRLWNPFLVWINFLCVLRDAEVMWEQSGVDFGKFTCITIHRLFKLLEVVQVIRTLNLKLALSIPISFSSPPLRESWPCGAAHP